MGGCQLMAYSLHDDMNGITSAVWLALVVSFIVLGALCSRNIGHQNDRVPYLDTGCLV